MRAQDLAVLRLKIEIVKAANNRFLRDVEVSGQRSLSGDAGTNPVKITDEDLYEEARLPSQLRKMLRSGLAGDQEESVLSNQTEEKQQTRDFSQ